MIAKLTFLPANQDTLNIIKTIYRHGNVKIHDNTIVLTRKTPRQHLYPLTLCGLHEINSNEENVVHKLADYILNNLNEDFFEAERNNIIQKISQENFAPIFSELGIISTLHKSLSEFSLIFSLSDRKTVLIEDLLPLIIKHFNPRSCIAINANIEHQQSIFSILKVGLYIKTLGPQKAKEAIDNNIGSGMIMAGASPILGMFDAYSYLASKALSLPIHLDGSSVHFIFDGAVSLGGEMRTSLQNIFQSSHYPMLEDTTQNYSKNLPVEMNHEYMWHYFKFCFDNINNIMAYANDPFNFLDKNDELMAEKQLQFFSALYILYADAALINHTANKHIQNHLAFGAIEKIANIARGHIKNTKSKIN